MALTLHIAPCQKAWQRELAHQVEKVVKPVLAQPPQPLAATAREVRSALAASNNRALKGLQVVHEFGQYGDRVAVVRPYTTAPELNEVCLYLDENPA